MNKVFNFLFIVVMILLSSITIAAAIPFLIFAIADGVINNEKYENNNCGF